MLGDTIRELREQRGWSQSDLAERCGTFQQTIGRYESGTHEPKASMITALSAAFGVTVSYLLGMDDDPNPHGVDLAADEWRLISCYRAADDRGRANILATAEREARTI